MRILVIGATGTIGAPIVEALEGRHEVLSASRHSGFAVDISDPESIRSMYRAVGAIDAVVCAAGAAAFAPLAQLSDEDFRVTLTSKLMGQVNVVRYGIEAVADGGSFTITTGILAQYPAPGTAAITLANAALEGFVRAAVLDMPNRKRINAVSPGWVSETLIAMGRDGAGGTPAKEVAKAYVEAVEGSANGTVLTANGG